MSHHYTIDTRSSRILSYGFFLVALLGVTQTCWAEQNEPSVATISEDAPLPEKTLPEKTLPTPNPLGSKGDIEIRALTFKGVEAGVTTVEQLKEFIQHLTVEWSLDNDQVDACCNQAAINIKDYIIS